MRSGVEKLCEDALIKLSTVATDLMGVSGPAMIEALIAGERDPHVLAELARGRLRVKHAALVQALTGRFDAHHAQLARMLLDAYDSADAQIRRLSERIEALIAALPAAQGVEADGTTGPHAGIGPDMTRFPTAAHLISWARLSPRTVQSGPRHRAGKTGKGNPYLKGVLGEAAAAAAAAAKTDTFLGARYRRLVKRRGKLKALVAVARSIFTIVWHLLANPDTRYHDLGADYHTRRIDTERRTRSHVRQLEALSYNVTLAPA